MKELLTGQGAPALGAAPQSAELNAGGQASHEENSDFRFQTSDLTGGEARDLGPGEVEKMFGPATTPLDRLRAAGNVEENPAEMGGGGDAIDDWVVKKGGYDELLQQIQQNGWIDNMVWPLDDGTKLSVAEVKRRAAVAVTPPPPEPQPAPRAGDWRGGLPPDQQQWLTDLQRSFGVDKDKNVALLTLQNMIKEVDSNPRQLSRGLLLWGGSRNELRIILLRLGEEVQHQLAMENVLKLSLDRQQNTGEQVATKFLVELKQVLVKQFPNDLEKQNELVINLYERLRRDDALGFSPDIGLIPRGADIGILMRILKSMLGRNGG